MVLHACLNGTSNLFFANVQFTSNLRPIYVQYASNPDGQPTVNRRSSLTTLFSQHSERMKNFTKYDYLIVGSGLFGATFAYRATQAGKRCLVIDRRPQLGGNVYCEDSLVPFNRYTNSPVANYKGKLYNLPFNMNTFYQMWGVITPEQAQAKIDEQKAEAVAKLGGREPQNLEEQALTLVGKDIYEKLIKGYTEKQWGRSCTELPAFIIRRLPVRLVYDNNYFNDAYQGIPVGGYNVLIEKLLEGSDCVTGVDYFIAKVGDVLPKVVNEKLLKNAWHDIAEKMVFTGKIDQFYDYRFGQLQYRTVRFEQETLQTPNYQGNAVINYTEREVPFTRIIEHKHFESFGQAVYDNPKTVISREYSTEWTPGMEPFYPVNDDKNAALYKQYKSLADQQTDVLFGGRLAEYAYYDMAPVIQKVLNMEIWS